MTKHNRDSHAKRAGSATAMAIAMAMLLTATTGQAAQPEAGRPLRVMLDKAEVLPLSGNASVVLVANPQIADVVLERGRLLFVLGKRPGETRLYVYGDKGQRLIERDVVVVPQHERTVTITRGTRATDYGCEARCAPLGFSAGVIEAAATGDAPSPTAAPQPVAATPAPAPVTTPAP